MGRVRFDGEAREEESIWEEAGWEEEEEEDLSVACNLLLAVARLETLDLARSKLRGCERREQNRRDNR